MFIDLEPVEVNVICLLLNYPDHFQISTVQQCDDNLGQVGSSSLDRTSGNILCTFIEEILDY